VVRTDTKNSEEWMARIAPLVEGRAVHLNYHERESWKRWSLPAQLFALFGPQPMPSSSMPRFLPVIILFRQFQRPKMFSFREFSRERELTMEQLRSELARG
jgi:hypothetical protein